MIDLHYNKAESRYEKDFDGHSVYATTREVDGVLYIDYVFAPPELRGSGAAGQFMEALMAEVKNKGFKAKPICGYAVSWLRRHDEYTPITL